jgi:medium-chain acyl-[acyl-carrier-protein] hydrolase
MNTPLSPWLVCPAPRPHAQASLVCFPFAGGGVAAFAGWGRQLDPRIELHIAHLPGRESRLREAPESRVEVILSALADAVARLPERQTLFFGHSLGAMLGFEVIWCSRAGAHPVWWIPARPFTTSPTMPSSQRCLIGTGASPR